MIKKELYNKVNEIVHKKLEKQTQKKFDEYLDIISHDIVEEILEEEPQNITEQFLNKKVSQYIKTMIRHQMEVPDEVDVTDLNNIIYKLNDCLAHMKIPETDKQVLVYHISQLVDKGFDNIILAQVMQDMLYQDTTPAKQRVLEKEIKKKVEYLKSEFEYAEEMEDCSPQIYKHRTKYGKHADIIPFTPNRKSHP